MKLFTKTFLTLAVLSLAFLGGAEKASAAIPTTERDALIALYNSTDGANWNNNTNWLGAAGTECSWYGITCGGGDTTVLWIELESNQLSGTLPTAIGDLTNITYMHFDNNQISGSIPTEIGNLSQLISLLINNNNLTGSIPTSIGNNTNLQYLYLNNNQLSGSIPTEIGNLTNLISVYLQFNNLTGSIPSSIGNLVNVYHLFLHRNQLSGSLPPEMGNLSTVDDLYLYGNQFTGAIPPEFGNLSSVTKLYIYDNQLTGPLPAELGNLSQVTNLSLRDNLITGPIPPEWGGMTDLQFLYLYNNLLSGPLPSELGNLTNLFQLYIANNQITGSIPPELGGMSSLQYLWATDNLISGTIPPEMGNLSNIIYFDFYSNELTGAIPDEIGSLTNMTELYLGQNNLTDPLPNTLGNLSSLQYFWIDGNNFASGEIPQPLIDVMNLASFVELNSDDIYCSDNSGVQTLAASKSNLTLDLCPILVSSEGTWNQLGISGDGGVLGDGLPGDTEIIFSPAANINIGDTLILTFPDTVVINDTATLLGGIISVTNQVTPAITSDPATNSITIPITSEISANTPITFYLSSAIQSIERIPQQSMGIIVQDTSGGVVTYGASLNEDENDVEIMVTVLEALIMKLDNTAVTLTVDPSVNNGVDQSQKNTLTVSTNSPSYSITAKLENSQGTEGLYYSDGTTDHYITNGISGENIFGFNTNTPGEATSMFSSTSQPIFTNQAGNTNHETHDIFYDLDVDYLTQSGVYQGIITYTAVPAF